MCFIASPVLESFDDVAYFGLNMNDFAIHDPTKDVLFSQSISSGSPAAVSTKPPTTVDKSVGSLPTPLHEPKEASSSEAVRPSGLLGALFGSKLNSNYPANKKAKKHLAAARSEVAYEYSSSLATSNESLSSSQSIKTLKESNSSLDMPSVHNNNAITPTLCPRISQQGGTTENYARLECAFKEVNSTRASNIA